MKKKKPVHGLLQESEKNFLLRFFALFAVLYLILHAADAFPPTSYASAVLKGGIASFETGALQLIGIDAVLEGNRIVVDGQAFLIVVECTGLFMIMLLAVLLYTTPVRKERRKRALLFYSPLLFGFNLLRVLFTLVVGVRLGASALEVTHFSLWFADLGLVLFLWTRAAEIRI